MLMLNRQQELESHRNHILAILRDLYTYGTADMSRFVLSESTFMKVFNFLKPGNNFAVYEKYSKLRLPL